MANITITSTQIGLIIQVIGVAVILIPQIHFLWNLRKKYNGLKRGCLEVAAARFSSDGEPKVMTNEEVDKLFPKFPLAEWIYSDLKISLFGLAITLAGLLVELFPN
jgi:hypothetical protein